MLFEEFFTLSFGVNLEPLTPYFLARRLVDASKHAVIDDLEPSAFTA